MRMQELIKAVGTGPKGNRPLMSDEIVFGIDAMLSKVATPAQIGSFLTAWRVAYETDEDIQAAYNALVLHVRKKEAVAQSVEVAYAYDGKQYTPYVYPLCTSLLAPFDLKLAMSSDDLVPAKSGIPLKDVLDDALKKELLYSDRKEFLPELSALTPLRHELGVRTIFNTIEKLPHVFGSQYALIGYFHGPYAKKYATMLQGHYERVVVVKGSEGSPEVFKKGTLHIIDKEKIAECAVSPEMVGLEIKEWKELMNAEAMHTCLQFPDEVMQKLAQLHAAIALVAAKRAQTVDEALGLL